MAAASSIRSIRAPFRTPTATASATSPGIIERLDYLGELGVDAIWLSPIFPSPMADFGYDIADYCGIDPLFGTPSPISTRWCGARTPRGLKVILDFVPNHTSDQHPWFVESRSSRDNPKRDWYLWRDPRARRQRAEQLDVGIRRQRLDLDDATRPYYYHAFLREQPDLNWRNPQVREAIYDVMRFWLGGRRWLSRRRDLASDQGRSVSRQPAQSGFSRRPAAA